MDSGHYRKHASSPYVKLNMASFVNPQMVVALSRESLQVFTGILITTFLSPEDGLILIQVWTFITAWSSNCRPCSVGD
jgi:hypothetical protein